jgi:hypothetical protein
MKEFIGISATTILFGIAGARAEEQVNDHNIVLAAARNVQYYPRQR